MAEHTQEADSASAPEDDGRIFVSVPADQAQAVMEFLAKLQNDADDVGGYSISPLAGIGSGRISSSSAGGQQGTLHNCKPTSTVPADKLCDTDAIITSPWF
jgi:hypothetical protein